MAIPFLSNINLNKNEIQNAVLHNRTSDPTGVEGQIYYNTNTNKVMVHNGTEFVDVSGDITAILEGNGISVSGNQGDVTVSINADTTNDFQFNSSVLELKDIITAGDVGSSTAIPVITYDATGRITAVTTAAISTEFTLTDGTTSQTIAGGDTLTITAADEIEATVSATDTLTIGHADVSRTNNTSTASPASGGTFTAIDSITTNARGHVTAVNTKTVTIPVDPDQDVTVANLITRLGEISENVTIGDAADVTVIIPGNLQVTGTTTTNNVETVSTSNGVVFEGNAADANELTLLAGTLTADRTVTLPDATGTVALTSDINDATLTVEGSSGLTGSGTFTANDADNTTITISHDDTSSQASVDNSGLTVIQDVTLDDYGHVTALGSADLTSAVESAGKVTKKISGDGTTTSFTVTHSFGTPIVSVQVLDYGDDGTGATYEVVYTDVQRSSDNAVTIGFGTAPTTTEDYLVLVSKFPAIS